MYLEYPANSTGDGGAGTHRTSGACENEGRCPLVLRRQDRDTQKGELCVWQRRPAAARTRALLKSVIWETEEEKPRPSYFESPEKSPSVLQGHLAGGRAPNAGSPPGRDGREAPPVSQSATGERPEIPWGTPGQGGLSRSPGAITGRQVLTFRSRPSAHRHLVATQPRDMLVGCPPDAPVTWLHLCHSPVCAGRGGPTRQAAESTPGLPALESRLPPPTAPAAGLSHSRCPDLRGPGVPSTPLLGWALATWLGVYSKEARGQTALLGP